jgi:hypothetical protein
MMKCPKSEQTVEKKRTNCKKYRKSPSKGGGCGAFFANFPFQTLTKAGVVLYNEVVEPTTKNII